MSIYSHIKTSLAMSIVHPCYMVSRCPVSRCQSPQFWWSRDVRSCVFSRPVKMKCMIITDSDFKCFAILLRENGEILMKAHEVAKNFWRFYNVLVVLAIFYCARTETARVQGMWKEGKEQWCSGGGTRGNAVPPNILMEERRSPTYY